MAFLSQQELAVCLQNSIGLFDVPVVGGGARYTAALATAARKRRANPATRPSGGVPTPGSPTTTRDPHDIAVSGRALREQKLERHARSPSGSSSHQ